MAKSLLDYIVYYKPEYKFILKATTDLTKYNEELKKFFDEVDINYELKDKSEVKRNGFRKDIDFSGNDITETWEVEFTTNYPVTDFELQKMIKKYLVISDDSYIIRKSKSAEIIDSDKRAEEDDESKEALLSSDIKPLEDVKQEELAGQKYTDDMLKALKDDKSSEDESVVKNVRLKTRKPKAKR